MSVPQSKSTDISMAPRDVCDRTIFAPGTPAAAVSSGRVTRITMS
jgi:hypothetical protein